MRKLSWPPSVKWPQFLQWTALGSPVQREYHVVGGWKTQFLDMASVAWFCAPLIHCCQSCSLRLIEWHLLLLIVHTATLKCWGSCPLHSCFNGACMFGDVTMVDDNVINYAPVPREPSECLIHPTIVMFKDGWDSIWARRYLKWQNGVMKVVSSWLSSSREHWWYPFIASNLLLCVL